MKDGRVIKANHDHWRLVVEKRCNPSVNHGHCKEQNIQKEELYDFEGEVFVLKYHLKYFM